MSNHVMARSIISLAIFVMMIASAVNAVAPKLMSYQGKATDASGNPVPDGVHNVRFDLYNAVIGGQSYWHEEASVTTSGGLFSHTLGSVTPIATNYFHGGYQLYLQVTFEGEVQSPRTQLTSTGYAFQVESVDGSEGGVIREYLTIWSDAAGDEIVGIEASTGDSKVWLKDIDGHKRITLDAADPSLTLNDYTYADSAKVTANSFELPHARMMEDQNGGAGYFSVDGYGGSSAFYVDGNLSNFSFPMVGIPGSSRTALFTMSATGSSSVALPNDAIEAVEMLDEPGVGSCVNSSTVVLTQAVQNICGRTMFAPVDGYVLVTCVANVHIFHTYGTMTQVSYGVSDNISSYMPSAMISIVIPAAAQGGDYYFPMVGHSLFPISEGSHAYYFLANRSSATVAEVFHSTFTELFVPTAYTTVHNPVAAVDSQPAVLDPDVERAEAEASRQIRLQAELDKIAAQLEELRFQIGDNTVSNQK